MALCGRLSSKFLQPGRLRILKGGGFSVAIGGSGRGIVLCSVSEQSERNVPARRVAAEDNPFVKPLSNIYFVVPCRFCQGSGEVKCDVCNGQGNLARGGFHKKNPVAMARIVGCFKDIQSEYNFRNGLQWRARLVGVTSTCIPSAEGQERIGFWKWCQRVMRQRVFGSTRRF